MPSKTTCFKALADVAKQYLDPSEVKAFALEFDRRVKALEAEGSLTKVEHLMEDVGTQMIDALTATALRNKRDAAANLKLRLKIFDNITTKHAKNPVKGLNLYFLRAAAEQNTLIDRHIGGFVTEMEEAGLLSVLAKGHLDEAIAQELWRLQDGMSSERAASPETRMASQIAGIMNSWQEYAVRVANDHGANIKWLPGYIVKQSHNIEKMLPRFDWKTGSRQTKEQAFQKWKNTISPLLDEKKTFDGVEPEQFLRDAYEALISGVHLSPDAPNKPNLGSSNLAKKLGQERTFHFKDGSAWFKYNKEYGTGNLREAYVEGLSRLAHSTILLKRFGTNPKDTATRVARDLRTHYAGHPETKALMKLREQDSKYGLPKGTHNIFAEILGETRIPVNRLGADVAASMRAWETAARLGMSVITSWSDIAAYAGEAHYQGRSLLTGYIEALEAVTLGQSKDKRLIASSLGVFSDSLRGRLAERFSAQDNLPGVASRSLQFFFKLNLLRRWTDNLKRSSALAMAHNLAEMRNFNWDELTKQQPRLASVLKQYDIDAAKWDFIRSIATKEADGRQYISPDAIQEIDNAIIQKHLGLIEPASKTTAEAAQHKKLIKAKIRQYKFDLELALRTYLIDRAEATVLQPGVRERAILRRGTQPGTVEGELMRFISQFKAYPISLFNKIIERDLNPTDETHGLIEAFMSGKADMLGLANTFIMMTLIGYASMSTKDVLRGKNPRALTTSEGGLDTKTLVAAMLQGGALGIYGDFLFGQSNRFGKGPIDTLAGPVLSLGSDFLEIAHRAAAGDDVSATLIKKGIDNTPFLNLFWIRPILDFLIIHQFQESINPGYLYRLQRSIEKDTGQTYWHPPSEYYGR